MEVREASVAYKLQRESDCPPGYKQTEVGVIPEDWDAKPLYSFASVKSGKRLPLGRTLVDHETPHPYIRVADMVPGTVCLSEIKYVPADVFPAIKRYRIFVDDIFISVAGTLGIVGKIPPELNGANLTENADRVTDITCSRDYLLYVLMSLHIQNIIESIRTVGAQPKLALVRIRKFDIPLPPTKAEQEAIARALSDTDALIESLEQLIAKKHHIKQGAMQELLTGKRRLPGFSGEWEVKRLDEIATFFSGGTPSTKIASYYGGDIPWITSSDLNRSLIWDVNGRITKEGLDNSSAKMIDKDTLLIALYGATSGVTAISKIRAAINQAVLAIIPQEANTQFLFFMLSYLKDWVISTYTQGGQPNLSGEIVKSIEINFPLLEEQTAIAKVLSDMDTEITALETQLAKTRQLKQGMMHELLTGRIRFN